MAKHNEIVQMVVLRNSLMLYDSKKKGSQLYIQAYFHVCGHWCDLK